MATRLVLVGGGQAHLFVLEGLARGRLGEAAVTLVAADPEQAHAAMLPGLITGRYRPEELELDLAALARAAGAECLSATASRIEPRERTITLTDGRRLEYDLASVALDSANADPEPPGVREHALAVWPARRAAAIVPALERAVQAAGPEPLRAVVVGAGPVGIQVALAVRARLDRLGANAVVILLERHHTLLRGHSPASEREVRLALGRKDVTLRLGLEVTEAGPQHVRLANGQVLPCDILIWAAGRPAPALFRESELPTDPHGLLLVDPTLRTVGVAGLFGAEGVALQEATGDSRVEVSPLRAGPVLLDNLAQACRGKESLRPYRPQPWSPSFLDTGDGRAILSYGPLAITAGWALTLKERTEREFVARFRRLYTETKPAGDG